MALFKILKGQEKNLPANKTEGWAYVTTDEGNMYVDVSASKRVKIGAHADKADVATKAEGDTKSIREIYLAKLKQVTSDGTQFTFRGETGNGTNAPDLISIPLAGDKAGLISNAAQTIKGEKTFVNGIKFPDVTSTTYPAKSVGLTWAGSTDGAKIYYEVQASDKGMLIIEATDDANAGAIFRNSSSGKTVSIIDGVVTGAFTGNLTGTANNAISDNAGKKITSYVYSVTKKSPTIFTVTKGDGTTNDVDLYFAASANCGGDALSALTMGQGNDPNATLDANDLIINNARSKKTFYATNTDKMANRPSGTHWGYLDVGSYGTGYTTQMFINGANADAYVRVRNNTWGAWKQFAFTDGKIKNAEFADKATGDTTTIRSTYIASIKQVTSNGTTFTFRGYAGDGSEKADLITIPNASSSVAGLITTDAQTIAGDKTFTGMIYFPNVTSGLAKGIQWAVGDNDFARIRAGATASNNGYLEIATADDATEPIYVRQYSGVFATLKRTLTLLDANGNTCIPGSLYDKNNQELRASLFLASLFTKTSNGTQLTIGGKNTGGTELSTLTIPNASTSKAGLVTADAKDVIQSFIGDKTFNGCVRIKPTSDNGRQGLRIGSVGGWSMITLGASADVGYEVNTWHIADNNGTFYITHNGSNSSTTGILQSDANGHWRIDNSLGIGGKNAAYTLYVNGASYFDSTRDSTYSKDGNASIVTTGGVSIAGRVSANSVKIDNADSGTNTEGCIMKYNSTCKCIEFIFGV